MKKAKIGFLYGEGEMDPALDGLRESLESSADFEVAKVSLAEGLSWDAMANALQPFEVALLCPSRRVDVAKKIESLSVNSHLLSYCDFLERRNDQWWARSLLGNVFNQLLVEVLKIRDFKGPVIFLGYSPLVLPLIEVLGRFGFTDIFFLETQETSNLSQPEFLRATKPMINLKLSTIDSTAFIQSQREYALCFLLDKHYTTEVLEDMSYFHFLSARSTVFDMSGGSNFQYEEVKALGVHLIESSEIAAAEERSYRAELAAYLKKRPSLKNINKA